jgi:hypothetical protein
MGGHAAWRKRIAAGELAKGSGGAALRHRPRLGRRGLELALNRLGNLGGHGNPKKKATKRKIAAKEKTTSLPIQYEYRRVCRIVVVFIISIILILLTTKKYIKHFGIV